MTGTYEDAIILAVTAHHGQTRWDGSPYVLHPLRVARDASAAIIGKGFTLGSIQQVKVVAVLHDVLEDTEVGYAQISSQFGLAVAQAVDVVTNDGSLRIRRKRADGTLYGDKLTYAEFIDSIAESGNETAIRVKVADLKDNMSTLPEGHGLWDRYRPALAKLEALL